MSVEFWVNQERVRADEPAGMLVLDWLRLRQQLTGTKEGCKEGDCGACSVLIGTLDEAGGVRYQPVTSCLTPLGELHGRHLLTIEGLNLPQPQLNPVQEAMVAEGGSQCGYCTPGFIVSMCWHLMQGPEAAPSLDGFKHAVSGNLCRCTGYGSIWRASEALVSRLGPGGDLEGVWQAEDRVAELAARGLIPAYLQKIPAELAALQAELDDASAGSACEAPEFVIAGGTDLYVQRGEEIPIADVEVLGRRAELDYIVVEGDTLRLGALTSFETFASDARVQAMIPSIKQDMALIASLPIRNRASIAGNLINASPIGDMTALMLALGAEVVLRRPSGDQRTLPLDELYVGYKQLAKDKDELVVALHVPCVQAQEQVSFEKVSKRKWLDIATVNSAARLSVDDDGVVTQARLTLGGVAATPLYLKGASTWLVGQTLSEDTVRALLAHVDAEIAPISDVRGSAQYKRLLARQLVLAHFDKLYPQHVSPALVLGAPLAASAQEEVR